MNIALIGATGRVGSRVAAELLKRGHHVTGIVRKLDAVAPQPGVKLVKGDANEPSSLAPLLGGHDAVISASHFLGADPKSLLSALSQAGVTRLLVVGGAASLEVAPGKRLLDAPGFPDAYRPEATAGTAFLDGLRKEPAIDWTFLSPSALLEPGERTGKFRIGGDQLLSDANGKSWISMEDYAVALVDELEQHAHSRARFTVGY
jgi:putative NADH-flavin reductase